MRGRITRYYRVKDTKTKEEKEFEDYLENNVRVINNLRRVGIFSIDDLKTYLQENGSLLGIYGIGKTIDELVKEIIDRNEAGGATGERIDLFAVGA